MDEFAGRISFAWTRMHSISPAPAPAPPSPLVFSLFVQIMYALHTALGAFGSRRFFGSDEDRGVSRSGAVLTEPSAFTWRGSIVLKTKGARA